MSAEVPLPSEILEFIRNNPRTFLLSRRKDGSPTGHPMLCVIGNDHIQFSTYRKSVKVKNLQRDTRTAVLSTTKPDTTPFKAALIRGEARILEAVELPPREVPKTDTWISSGVTARSKERLATGKRTIVEIAPREASQLKDVRKKK